MKKRKEIMIGVGSIVWYKGAESGVDDNRWKKWEVCQILEPKSRSPRLLLRSKRELWGDDDAQYDYAVVDMAWTFCLPDTPGVRKKVRLWNEAAVQREKVDAWVEEFEIGNLTGGCVSHG